MHRSDTNNSNDTLGITVNNYEVPCLYTKADVIEDCDGSAAMIVGIKMAPSDVTRIGGFRSSDRNYYRVAIRKTFNESLAEWTSLAISAAVPAFLARVGRVIRPAHITAPNYQMAEKSVLMFTDGDAADIDAPDQSYLRLAPKRACHSTATDGNEIRFVIPQQVPSDQIRIMPEPCDPGVFLKRHCMGVNYLEGRRHDLLNSM